MYPIHRLAVLESHEREACALCSRALDTPRLAVRDDGHVLPIRHHGSISPGMRPTRGIRREVFAQLEQRDVQPERARLREVVGMRQERDQPVLFADVVNLLLPERDRVVAQDVKQRVILNAS